MAELTLRNVKLRLRLNLRQKLIPTFCMPTTMEQARLFIIPITMDMDTDLEDTMDSEDTMDTMDIPTATMATMANKVLHAALQLYLKTSQKISQKKSVIIMFTNQ